MFRMFIFIERENCVLSWKRERVCENVEHPCPLHIRSYQIHSPSRLRRTVMRRQTVNKGHIRCTRRSNHRYSCSSVFLIVAPRRAIVSCLVRYYLARAWVRPLCGSGGGEVALTIGHVSASGEPGLRQQGLRTTTVREDTIHRRRMH